MSIKAIIWDSCGSLPSPASSATIRGKVKAALWAARDQTFTSEIEVDTSLDSLPHHMRGTFKANTSCVQIEAGSEDVILCDAGTAIRDYVLSLPTDTQPKTFHILISHLHWNHIQGFPFFTPAYIPGNRIIFTTSLPMPIATSKKSTKAPLNTAASTTKNSTQKTRPFSQTTSPLPTMA